MWKKKKNHQQFTGLQQTKFTRMKVLVWIQGLKKKKKGGITLTYFLRLSPITVLRTFLQKKKKLVFFFRNNFLFLFLINIALYGQLPTMTI